MSSRPTQSWSQRAVLAAPYLWLVVFFLIPFAIVFKLSLSQTAVAQPPYVPLLDLGAGFAGLVDFLRGLGVETYVLLFSDTLYLHAYFKSLIVALVSTAILLLIGFPMAYGMVRAPRRLQPLLVMLVVLPFWTSFLIRVYAWINILQRDGLLNSALLQLRIIDTPVAWLASDTAIFIGVVYSYLPFMVLPLYARLEQLDRSLLEAAADLGTPPWKTFWLVTVPLALPGVAAGVLLSFIPIVGEFVIPDLLGGSDSQMIGQVLWVEFFANKDWPVAAAIATVLLTLLVIPILLYERAQRRALEQR